MCCKFTVGRNYNSTHDTQGAKNYYTYNSFGNLEKIEDYKGNIRRFQYNLAGQLVEQSDIWGKAIFYAYNQMGKLISIEDERGREINYEYYLGGRLKEVRTSAGNGLSFIYDSIGRIKAKEDTKGYTLFYDYDCMGRIVKISSNIGQQKTFEYDKLGKVKSMTDAGGNTTQYSYTMNGALKEVTDPLGNKTVYSYDEADRLITLCQLGHEMEDRKTIYRRNTLGQVESVIDSMGMEEHFHYDSLGRIITKIDQEGLETSYTYGLSGRIEEILYNNGEAVSFTYDEEGVLIGFKDWLGETRIERNRQGKPICIKDYAGKCVRYKWGEYGEKRRLIYPNGKELNYIYDDRLFLQELVKEEPGGERVCIRTQYDSLGRLVRKTLPNGISSSYSYDLQGQLIEMTHAKDGEILDKYIYRYDHMGNKVEIEKKRKGCMGESGKYSFSYDAVQRLTGIKKVGVQIKEYEYDAFGNRKKISDNQLGIQVLSKYNELNQLVEEIHCREDGEFRRSFSYDQRGNLVAEYEGDVLRHAYHYNAMNRLADATNSKGEKANYYYNGLGQRIGRNEEKYLLDLTLEYNNLLTMYTEEKTQDFFGNNGVSFMEEGKDRKFFLSDELGSPLRVQYSSGKREVYGYDEFGESLEGNGYTHQGEKQPFGYTGYLYDSISNTYFAQAREYQPKRGRFISKDKGQFMAVGAPSSVNLYTYCRSNPLIYIDGLGNEVIVVTGGVEDDKKFRYPFVETALKNVHDNINAGIPKEDITWMVIQAGYTEAEMEKFQITADNLGIRMVEIETKNEFVEYINEKDGGISRAEDKITDMAFFGHGQTPRYGFNKLEENQLSFSYGTTKVVDESIDFRQSDIALLESEAFDHTYTKFYTCNAGTKDSSGKSFAQIWSNKTGGVSYGIENGRTEYSVINMAGTWGFRIPNVKVFSGYTILPGEIWRKFFPDDLWQVKQERKANRNKYGYSQLGSLNYPWMTSLAGDFDTVLDGGVFTRGWKRFEPECQATD